MTLSNHLPREKKTFPIHFTNRKTPLTLYGNHTHKNFTENWERIGKTLLIPLTQKLGCFHNKPI